jgi:hypothetical protein
MSDQIPRNIPQLWFLLDRRLTIIEEAQKAHGGVHEQISKDLDDHEQRLRSAGLPGIIAATVNSFVSLAAIIKVMLR